MFLKRVQVPDFRALQNVDISFEPQFRPRVFPLGSQNGGGKSTLLQLIFVLLNCSYNARRLFVLQDFLHDLELPNSGMRELSLIEIIDDSKNLISLRFFCYSPSRYADLFDDVELSQELKGEMRSLIETVSPRSIDESAYKQVMYRNQDLLLASKKIFTVGRISPDSSSCSFNDFYLLCEIEGLGSDSSYEILLNSISEKTFLAAPSTQIFLFTPIEARKQLFQGSFAAPGNHYYSALKNIQLYNPNLFTYDFFSADLLINAFRKAFDDDNRQKAETGHYGNAYDHLLEKMNALLVNKQIHAQGDLSGIRFSMQKNGQTVELLPEDLSHGELKRLSIYMWLDYFKIKDAIVLMDEIEIALHPDWQYHIVGDLVEWGPTNQYILATHSYELCQALPPAHVKEIEPNLLPQAQPA
jgi:predicted ATPase